MILASIKKKQYRTMIKHYLKVALRNLMNFKVHSLISAICFSDRYHLLQYDELFY